MQKTIIVGAFLLALAGCFTGRQTSPTPPSEIAISKALADIADGFRTMDKLLGPQTLGLFPCSLTVSLTVAASANESGGLVLGEPEAIRVEASGEAAESRQNEVSVGLYNPACVPADTVGFEHPTSLGDVTSGMIITKEEVEGAINNPVYTGQN